MLYQHRQHFSDASAVSIWAGVSLRKAAAEDIKFLRLNPHKPAELPMTLLAKKGKIFSWRDNNIMDRGAYEARAGTSQGDPVEKSLNDFTFFGSSVKNARRRDSELPWRLQKRSLCLGCVGGSLYGWTWEMIVQKGHSGGFYLISQKHSICLTISFYFSSWSLFNYPRGTDQE